VQLLVRIAKDFSKFRSEIFNEAFMLFGQALRKLNAKARQVFTGSGALSAI
jgi:hypothetical protein